MMAGVGGDPAAIQRAVIALQIARQKKNEELREALRSLRSRDPKNDCKDGDCCKQRWEEIKKEVGLIKNNPDPVERNKQINSSYADLYKRDPDGQKWAGTAAIVSKQVGCAMVNNPVANNNTLGAGNVAIFENIYPALKLYQTAMPPLSKEEFLACLRRVLKEEGKEDNLKNLAPAFEYMMQGQGDAAALKIADYEQGTVVNDGMWAWTKSPLTRLGAEANYWILGGRGIDQSISFAPDCAAPGSRTLAFPSDLNVANSAHRIQFYKDVFVPMFDRLESQGEIGSIIDGIRGLGGTY